MGFIIGFIKSFIKLLIYLSVLAAIIILIPNLPPYTTFSSIELEPTQARTGALAPNEVLNNPEKLFQGKLLGPEMFQIWNGDLYTGLATGEIVKVSRQGHITFVTKIGKPCTGIHQEHICGRPLGFVIDDNGQQMYIADAYLGIWKVDLRTDKKQLLVSPDVLIDGHTPKIFNDVALDKNGEVYWTHSSSEYHLQDGTFTALSDPSGRFLHYNAVKNESRVLLDKLWFANGVSVSLDNEFVLVAESARYRILKHFIEGPRKGKTEVFVAGLPGMPDNIRTLPDGSGVLVALYTVFDDEDPLLTRSLSTVPLARKFLARVLTLVENLFDFLNKQFPNHVFENMVYSIGHFATTSSLLPDKSGLVQIDWNGNIVASYFNTDRKLLHISDAIVYGDKLYTACPHKQDFIGALPVPPLLKKAFTPPTSKPTKPNVLHDIINKEQQIKKETKKTQESKPPVQKPQVPKSVNVEKPQTPPKPVENIKANKDTKTKETQQTINKKPEQIKTVNVDQKVKSNDAKVNRDENMIQPNEKKEAASMANDKENLKLKQSADTGKTISKETGKPKPTQTKVEPEAKPKQVVKESNKPQTKEPSVKPEAKPEKVDNIAKKQNIQDAPKPSKPEPTKPKESVTEKPKPNVEKQQIPIVEEIPSDTAKPPKEKLKVIKKSGPEEIPNPNV